MEERGGRTHQAHGQPASAQSSDVTTPRYGLTMKGKPMTESVRVVELLGGRRALGATADTASALIALIRRGLPLSTVRGWPAGLGLTRREVEIVLGLGARALERRTGPRLTPVESERAVRVARLVARAESVFRDRTQALEWCQSPQPSLDGETPFQFMDTEMGGRAVRELLERIESGHQPPRSARGSVRAAGPRRSPQ